MAKKKEVLELAPVPEKEKDAFASKLERFVTLPVKRSLAWARGAKVKIYKMDLFASKSKKPATEGQPITAFKLFCDNTDATRPSERKVSLNTYEQSEPKELCLGIQASLQHEARLAATSKDAEEALFSASDDVAKEKAHALLEEARAAWKEYGERVFPMPVVFWKGPDQLSPIKVYSWKAFDALVASGQLKPRSEVYQEWDEKKGR